MAGDQEFEMELYLDVCHHLDQVNANPQAIALDAKKLNKAKDFLPDKLYSGSITSSEIKGRGEDLIMRLAKGLSNYQNPEPATTLLSELLRPWSWSEICDLGKTFPIPDAECLAPGAEMVPFNMLMLSLMEKAGTTAANAAEAAVMVDNIKSLVICWLVTPDTAVAIRCLKLLLRLLAIDQEVRENVDDKLPIGPGQGLVWKRLFGDRDVYANFFDLCSEKGSMAKKERTIAQGRLFEFVTRVAMDDWPKMTKPQHPDIEERYGVKGGLLDFAALHMVDFKDDVLMHICLVDFYADILTTTIPKIGEVAGGRGDSVGLQYLIAHGLHARVAALYLQPRGTTIDPIESMLLRGPAANYIAIYASGYRQHFLGSEMAEQVQQCLKQNLSLPLSQWSQTENPKHDLYICTSIPRSMLLPSSISAEAWNSSILALLPSRASDANVLHALSRIFKGPSELTISFSDHSLQTTQRAADYGEEKAMARALYFHYIAHTPTFWNHICKHAGILALGDVALAAIRCMDAVITANWPEPSSSSELTVPLPTTIPTPETGSLAILSPGAVEYILPWLFTPTPSFTGVIGGNGTTENTAYNVTMARFEVLKRLYDRLADDAKRSSDAEDIDKIRSTIRRILEAGPFHGDRRPTVDVATVGM